MIDRRHSLLVTLIVTTLVVTIALSWAGWRLLNQQRSIDQQRAQEQLGATAKSMVATLRGKLAETGERLSQAAANPMAPLPALAGAGVLTFSADGALNATGLPFVPRVQNTAAVDAVFHDAEVFEFANADLRTALNRYQALTSSADPTTRAGALMRLARVAKKRGDTVN